MGPRAASTSRDVAPTITAQPPSLSSSSRHGSVDSLPAQKPHDGASLSPSQRSSDGRDREGWWTASGFHDDPSTSHAWTPSPSSSNRRGRVASWTTWQPHENAPTSTQPPSPPPPNRRGSEGSWPSWKSWKTHDNAPTSTQPPSPPPPNRRGSAGSWASWKSWKPHDNVPTPPSPSPYPSSPHTRGSAGSLVAQRPNESTATPPVQPLSPVSSSSSSGSSAEYGFVLAARLEPFAPPMQASTSLQTAITAESEPAQDASTVSLPVVVVQRRDGSGSWSRLNSSRTSSRKSLVPAVPPAPRSSPPATPPPERSRSPSPPNLGRGSWSPRPLPAIAGQGLGLYIPRQSHSGSLSLSTPDTRFHTPVDESAEPGVGTQVYPSNPALPASAPASIPTSTSASCFRDRADTPEPLDGWPRAPSGADSPISGRRGKSEMVIWAEGVKAMARSRPDSRSRSASGRSTGR
ncbi:hypothetical protein EDB87DRAFT_426323 [Lactarius vividus]|nr:hypothetical protein EDB87DRAFT_426323 [Lactarius vividus]